MILLQAWVNECYVKHWNTAANVQLEKLSEHPRALGVHRLCFYALQTVFEDNHHVQIYLARQRCLAPLRVPTEIVGAVYNIGPGIGDPNRNGSVSGDTRGSVRHNPWAKWGVGQNKKLSDLTPDNRAVVIEKMEQVFRQGEAVDKYGNDFWAPDSIDNFTFGVTRVFLANGTIPCIIRQINAGTEVGATDCLRRLLSNNMSLLNSYVDADTVRIMSELISDRGPEPQYMSFFCDVASCQGQAVESNQQEVLYPLPMLPTVSVKHLTALYCFCRCCGSCI